MLAASLLGAGIFLFSQLRAAFPLIRLEKFRDWAFSSSLAMSGIVSTIMMSTLVVGPFYLTGALGLRASSVGLVLSAGPLVTALSGIPAGRLADRFGARRTTVAGLRNLLLGAALFARLPVSLGVPGYLGPLVLLTSGYALFQTSNNTVVMAGVSTAERGLVSGLLNLSRNLGLVTGASAMGALFSLGAGGGELSSAPPEALAAGLHLTFGVAALLVVGALVLARQRLDAAPLVKPRPPACSAAPGPR